MTPDLRKPCLLLYSIPSSLSAVNLIIWCQLIDSSFLPALPYIDARLFIHVKSVYMVWLKSLLNGFPAPVSVVFLILPLDLVYGICTLSQTY